MSLRAALALALLAAGPAAAEGTLLVIENRATRAVDQIAIFPLARDGRVIDDVLAASHDPLPPGQSRSLDTGLLACAPVQVWARLSDGEEVAARTDLCRNSRLIVQD